jgi:uncharacterized membrane protein (UPF0127 family)
LSPLLRDAAGGYQLVAERSGRTVATDLLIAFDSASRNTGLLHHKSLDPQTALFIAPCNSIHTFFMKFSIDVAFMAKDGRVIKRRTRIPPWRLSMSLRAHSVIEFAAGVLDEADVRAGDRLAVVPKAAR